MELLLLLIQIPFLVFIIKYIRKKHSDSLLIHSYYYLLSLKVTAGLFLGILYFNYYKLGDTLVFNFNLELLSELFYTDFKSYWRLILFNEIPTELATKTNWFTHPRAFFFIRYVSPLYILSGSNYWMLSIYLSVFSFSGLWRLSDTLIKLFKVNSVALLLSFFIFPSVVLWSSGVIKESLVIGVMCYIISIALNLAFRQHKISVYLIAVLLVFSWILLQIKFYYFAVLFAVLIPYCLIKLFSFKIKLLENKIYRISAFLSLLLVFGILASLFHPLLNIDRIADSVYTNYLATVTISNGYNVFYFQGINAEISSFLPHVPKALSYGLFGPYLWHCKKVISLVVGVENTVLLILFTTFLLANFKKEKLKKADMEEISVVLYVCILATLMAFASPNWGTLTRYKVGYFPFFLLLILNKNPFVAQLEERVPFLKRFKKNA